MGIDGVSTYGSNISPVSEVEARIAKLETQVGVITDLLALLSKRSTDQGEMIEVLTARIDILTEQHEGHTHKILLDPWKNPVVTDDPQHAPPGENSG
jgi:uncharacterized coiled-coil protein SlyX